MSKKRRVDQEAKDLAALIIFSLRGIAETIERTTEAWEKRDYYLKADRFREQWRWLDPITDDLSAVAYGEQWDRLPDVLTELMPRFADVRIKRLTRKPSLWEGAYERLLQED